MKELNEENFRDYQWDLYECIKKHCKKRDLYPHQAVAILSQIIAEICRVNKLEEELFDELARICKKTFKGE